MNTKNGENQVWKNNNISSSLTFVQEFQIRSWFDATELILQQSLDSKWKFLDDYTMFTENIKILLKYLKIKLGTDPKIILLNHNNYVRRWMMNNAVKLLIF